MVASSLIITGIIGVFLEELISYPTFLLSLFFFFLGIISFYLLTKKKKDRLKQIGFLVFYSLLLVIQVSLTPTFDTTYEDVADSFDAYMISSASIPNAASVETDSSWFKHWSDAYLRYQMDVALFNLRSRSHTNRLLNHNFIADEEYEAFKALSEQFQQVHKENSKNALFVLYEAESLLDKLEKASCLELEDLSFCHRGHQFIITLNDETFAAPERMNRHSVFEGYFLIFGENKNYYLTQTEMNYSESRLEAYFNDLFYEINGDIRYN